MTRRGFNCRLLGIPAAASLGGLTAAGPALSWRGGFTTPPDSARPWTYWWWLNGYVSEEGIVRDLDEMKRQGIAGVLVFDAGGGPTPGSTAFMSARWRALFRFAVEQAARRNIQVSLNLCSGWNAGGPWVAAENAAQTIVFSEFALSGPANHYLRLPEPAHTDPYYRDIAVLAYRTRGENVLSTSLVDLSGRADWDVPTGEWLILRCGHTVASRAHTKLHGPEGGYEIDPFRAEAMQLHFAATAEKVMEDVRPWVGKTLKYFHIDSGEIGSPNWTSGFHEEFQRRRGYHPFPYLPVLAGKTVDNSEITARFREDFNRTLGDLLVENYYGTLAALSHRHGVGIHPESAGYQKPCEDALRAMGQSDAVMGEFWARTNEPDGYIHQRTPAQLRFHDSIKLASSAAHIYGREIVQAEAFTVYNPRWTDWSMDPFALKDIGDWAFCQGLNRNVLCFYVNQPELETRPGYQWPGCGTNFDRNITWWPMIHGWLTYLSRCQFLLRQGAFVADFLYFYGEEVPNFVPGKRYMRPALPEGCDCDSINAEALLARLEVRHGALVLPGGLSYRYLVLPEHSWNLPPPAIFNSTEDAFPGPGNGLPVAMSPRVMRRIAALVEAGATVTGPRPARAPGLTNYPASDGELRALAAALWGEESSAGERSYGKGRVIWGRRLEEILVSDGIARDFEVRGAAPGGFDYIHRRGGGTDLYFVSNQANHAQSVDCAFRATGAHAEWWDPVTGGLQPLADFRRDDGRTLVRLEFAPRQSGFIVFRDAAAGPRAAKPDPMAIRRLDGPWWVSFDPRWGGPREVTFDRLEDWTGRPEEGIRYYSGIATYRKAIELPEYSKGRLFLDLGKVRNVAAVRVNGKDAGVVWCAPWRLEIGRLIEAGRNTLEIDVANLWPNRLIGDARFPPERRRTKTNVTRFRPDSPLLPSGLLGPVTIVNW
ncbi:MAG: glycosyl hydrolase [Acidobacteria bacterium]|nr:glycosyl hydrolase [Acidobacteriota bacterium]